MALERVCIGSRVGQHLKTQRSRGNCEEGGRENYASGAFWTGGTFHESRLELGANSQELDFPMTIEDQKSKAMAFRAMHRGRKILAAAECLGCGERTGI